MDADPIYLAPQDYSITWPVLGAFIIFGLLLWAAAIWMLTRPRRSRTGTVSCRPPPWPSCAVMP